MIIFLCNHVYAQLNYMQGEKLLISEIDYTNTFLVIRACW